MQVSRALNWKLGGHKSLLRTLYGPHIAEAMLKTESFWLQTPVRSFDWNEWDVASMAVSRYNE